MAPPKSNEARIDAPSGRTMLTAVQIQQARTGNPLYARQLGWDKRMGEVTAFLGVTGAVASDPRLAENVYRFQLGHPPLTRDGMIGPTTWAALKVAFTKAPVAPANPGAPPPKNSTPTPDRVKALDNWLLSITDGHPKAKEHWTFYEEIDAYLGPFGDEGYPLGYGKKYCILFNNDLMLRKSKNAMAWVKRTTILLQTYLRAYIVERYRQGTLKSLTEEELRKMAFAQHPRAYTKGGLVNVMLLAPHMLPQIATIPATEFFSENWVSSWAQLITTGKLVIAEMAGTMLATAVGPAHTGLYARAHEKDRQEFRRRQQIGDFLDALKKAIESGKLDRVEWLERATTDLNRIEYPDKGLAKMAGDAVKAADARKKFLAARYRAEIRLIPALQAEFDTYDPGWSRW